MLVVVDLESETPGDVLGIFQRTDEDTVIYNDWETGERSFAPVDCVEVVPGYIEYRGPGGLKARRPVDSL